MAGRFFKDEVDDWICTSDGDDDNSVAIKDCSAVTVYYDAFHKHYAVTDEMVGYLDYLLENQEYLDEAAACVHKIKGHKDRQ